MDLIEAPRGVVIRLTPSPDDVSDADVVVVLDTTWTPPAGSSPTPAHVAVRDLAERYLVDHDLLAETSAHLDEWAVSSGVIDCLTVRGTSFWYYVRLRHWLWLQERLLWAAIAESIVRDHRPGTVVCAPGTDSALIEVLRLASERDEFVLSVERPEGRENPEDQGPDRSAAASGTGPAPADSGTTAPGTTAPGRSVSASAVGSAPTVARAGPRRPGGWRGRWPFRPLFDSSVGRLVRRVRRRNRPQPPPVDPKIARRRLLAERLERIRAHLDLLAAEQERRLLVVHEHAAQEVAGPAGPRSMNPYLDPILDQLRGTRLEPIVIDIRARVSDDAAWERIGAGRDRRQLPADALAPPAPQVPEPPEQPEPLGRPAQVVPVTEPPAAEREIARRIEAWRQAVAVPLRTTTIDLGPLLVAEVADGAMRWLPGMLRTVDRIQHLLERLQPAGVLLADEYHRQDWLTAAAAVGIPVAAVQHGMIYPRHNGYIHARRPSALRLPQRTFVFGRWEKHLLRQRSVYRNDEVVVGGSPRLDLVVHDPGARARIRSELGVADEDRLVLVSGTWGGLYRRFYYPIALARLIDRPQPRIHLVVKLHPGEPDDGPYRAIVESAARARGFDPPPVSTIRSVDLYQILEAADAHLGIHSTVLTEAVVTRTPNLIVTGLAGADILGYVEAGVAVPVRDGEELQAALNGADPEGIPEAQARRFVDAHFEPGQASARIAENLLEWLP